MRAGCRSDDDHRMCVKRSPAVGDEGAGFPEGDLGQAALTSCCLKQDTRAPRLPSTWITYLIHIDIHTDANAIGIPFLLLLYCLHHYSLHGKVLVVSPVF